MFLASVRSPGSRVAAIPSSGSRRELVRLAGIWPVLACLLVLLPLSARADASYHPLSTGDFSQDWSSPGLISTNDDWSGVPGLVGYLGQDITTTTGTNPQTLLTVSAAANDVDVVANQTNPNITNGGVAEFAIANPTVALQGSGTADAPYLLLHLDTTGRTGVIVRFNARDIDASGDNAIQQVAVQYRVGPAGNFVDLPSGYIADATTGPSLATQVTAVEVTLPVAAENQPQVQVRIMTTNAVGNDEWVGIDDIQVTSTGAGGGGVAPTITDEPDSVTVAAGGTAVFSVTANGTAPLDYQWRKDGLDLSDAGNVSGADTATLTLTNVQAADEADYTVLVSNGTGTDLSSIASLTVEVPVAPGIVTPPAPQTVFAGGTAVFSVTASGTAPLAYQWHKDGADLDGAIGATLTLTNVQPGAAAGYSVTVTNSVDSVTSGSAALTVVVPDLYWSLTAGSFSQDWSNPALITANDNWSAVPSLIGYLGQDITTGTGVDPQTLLGTSSVANDLEVIANAVNPNTLTSGGVAEFDAIANPTIALQGSGTADAPNLVLHLDTRGRTAVTVSYNLRDLDGSGDNAAQAVALQYRLGDTGPFTNLPAAYVADATQGPSLSGLVTPVSVVLPPEADNQAKVQLRFITTNAVGSDEWTGLDDLSVTSVSDGVARVFVTPTEGDTLVGESAPVTDIYSLRLNTAPAGPVTVRATADGQTEVSADGVNFGATADVVFTDLLPRAVTVRAVNDGINEAATHFSVISHAVVASADAAYTAAVAIPALTAGVLDDDGGTGVTRIHTIQGAGAVSPLTGYQVTINGVVTGFFTGSTGTRDGFFVQELDANADADPATSEGVYVFLGSASPLAATAAALNVGDVVTVTGQAAEYNGLTEVDTLSAITVGGTATLPAALPVTLPHAGGTYLERYEGMRISLPQTLTVTDNYDLGHFGQIILSHGRLSQPTNIVAPGAPAQAQLAANLANQILLDDGTSRGYPDPTPYLFDDGAGATLRAGDTTTGVSGVLTYQFGAYMLQPAAAPLFTRVNPRPAAVPAVGGSLRVSIGNVLNLFNGDGAGGGFPTSRGASNHEEYQRQLAKTVAGILAPAPDIMGLTEVENDGYGPASALAQLVTALNAAAPAGTTYAYVDAAAVDIVTDVIHSAFIYRVETVETVGAPAMLSSPYYNNHARNPLAQTFREKATGAVVTVSINHFRAKASVSSMSDGIVPNPNNDQGDGQGNNNYLRTKEAEALTAWLATDPTGSGDPDFLIIGDLNAYAKEDPITLLQNAGYVNLTEQFEGVGGYSYSFDGAFGHLDHALASPSLATQVTGAATWHVNADEPIYYDYNTEDKSVAQQAINTGTPYRYADHDPVIMGFNLAVAPVISGGPVAQTVTVGNSVTFSVTAAGFPAPTYQWRRNGVPISGADAASYTIASPVTADAGSYDVAITNSAGTVFSGAALLTVNPAPATLFLAPLLQAYDGTPRVVTAATTPAGLPVAITYAGSPTPPVNPGVYPVTATSTSPDYTGTVTDSLVVTVTALVRHAPVLHGGVDGSLQVLLPESITLNGSAWVSGDLLVPGTPGVQQIGLPVYAGTIDGTGAVAPSSHTVTLNNGAVLRHVVRRTDPLTLPVVAAPPQPTGTRSVTLGSANPTDFPTIRNLTMSGPASRKVTVPAGTYGTFTANGSCSFVFGVAGATEPAVYNLQSLVLNGTCRLVVVGPVIVNLANGLVLNATAGDADHPEWLEINLAAGGLTLNGTASLAGYVAAPAGTVTLNGSSKLTGGLAADGLTVTATATLIEPAGD